MKTIFPIVGAVVIAGSLVVGFSKGEEPTNKAQAASPKVEEVKQNEIESPYKEIANHFESWELPTEGVLPTSDEAYEGIDPKRIVIYENGYGFNKDTKTLLFRTYDENGKPIEPTPEQEIGVVLGEIADIADNPLNEFDAKSNSEFFVDTIDNKLSGLNEMKKYANGFEPLEEWIDGTIETFTSAKEADNDEKRWELFNEGMNKIEKLQEAIGK